MSEYFWHCPFCNRDETVTEREKHASFSDLSMENADGPRRLVVKYVVCPNPQCRKFSLTASLHGLEITGNRSYTGKHIKTWALIPPSRALSFPVAVPQKVLDDYLEACLTIDLSPKVAAALARRCLSEMLRDYWQVQPGRLIDEFRQIKGTVDPLTWEAIESVKKSGLTGARFESDSTQILDTDPGEAEMLIGLIETLVEDWYVAREERRKRLEKIRQISEAGVGEVELKKEE